MAISHRPAKYSGKSREKGRKDSKRGASGEKVREQRTGFILTVVEGQNKGKEHYFEREATIGRVENSDILIVEPGISRMHARVRIDHGVYLLEDLGSSNGTRLNGEKIASNEPEVLRDGDYITLAQTTLQFSPLEALRGVITADAQLGETDQRSVDVTDESTRGTWTAALRSRRAKLALLVFALLIGVGVIYKKFFHRQTIDGLFDLSDTPVTYSEDDDFFNAVFGNGRWDQRHVNQATINFEYLGGRATLQYGAWGVDKVGEVAILLNGERVGQVPLTMSHWTYGLRLVLPQAILKKNQTNALVFDNVRNPPRQDEWEICYVQIIQEAIPPPNAAEARHRFDLAKKSWEDREVEPGNMYNALVGFKLARDYLEGLEDRPELYQDALDHIDIVDKELTRIFQEGLFSARRAKKFDGDVRKARTVLLRTMRYFRSSDFRYRELKRSLDALAQL